METPRNKSEYRTKRNPTPRLSERKKKLFQTNEDKCNILSEEDDLQGILPLETRVSNTPKSRRSIETLLKSKLNQTPTTLSFLSGESESDYDKQSNPSPTRRSLRLTEKNTSPGDKENQRLVHADEQQLQQLFNTSMTLKNTVSPNKTPKRAVIMNETSEEEQDTEEENNDGRRKRAQKKSQTKKRLLSTPKNDDVKSPNRKMFKTISPLESIPTKAFYAAPPGNKSPALKSGNVSKNTPYVKISPRMKKSHGGASSRINRGVFHKVRKSVHLAPVNMDLVLNNIRNEKLKKIITSKREEREQIEKIHQILRQAENPIEMARPLSVISNDDDKNNNNDSTDKNSTNKRKHFEISIGNDFSDIEYESDDLDDTTFNDSHLIAEKEEVIPLITHKLDFNEAATENEKPEETVKQRKFFKSKRTNVMEVKITDNIKASVCNGKIQLVEGKKRKRPRHRPIFTNEFSDEQATVEAILKNLDDTAFGDLTLPVQDENENSKAAHHEDEKETDENLQQLEAFTNDFLSDIQLEDSNDYAEFRKRLPYNTTDPNVIEQQHLLLDFLITNNICNEENFKIFIAEPDRHREEAARILDNLVVVLNEEQIKFRDRIPYNTDDPKIIEQQQNFLYFLMENDICNEENFDIFIANYEKRKAEAEAIIAEIQARDCRLSEMHNIENDDDDFDNDNVQEMETETPLLIDKNHIEIISNISLNPNPTNTQVNIKAHEEEKERTKEEEQTIPFINVQNIQNIQIIQNIQNNEMIENVQNIENAIIVPEKQDKQKYFPIFDPVHRAKPLPLQPSTRRTLGRAWHGGFGSNQLQLDAGQKQFGPIQCKKCGLLYTLHEPEEEKLHREFHASLHIFRFRGWIDEDIVAIYPEWAHDGRIIRLKDTSYQKRIDRLKEILKIVDIELGFSSYILPDIFVAYLAVKKAQIVGVCLVQPLKEANKYLCINGVDCCSLETYEAKCGISRIWVSPLHRRFQIASKLISAVQFNTIVGEDIPLDKIAFSAPTEMGRRFAQKITKMENFLVYS